MVICDFCVLCIYIYLTCRNMSESHQSHRVMSLHLVLPPIITNERDRVLLTNLNQFIKDELRNTDEESVEQRFIVFKDAFDKVRMIHNWCCFNMSTLGIHSCSSSPPHTYIQCPTPY